ncbi:LacI family DNA-binding transcriptional regulator [Geochorda subterranea]|uniref:LacI family DNA-binding transcriptional regulator n=1 Tax=Geochorda subterranea TaxID=3109564 RepID=A0ABZ1BSC9_9FIRM|nr:LacI family DNA-binding transcriptional regulator [Limnochorda sp. LNt]WRP15644.1 LacI family DNA-binding transcriptional regulator [Limnochorda sp. LNt]
MRQGLQSVSVRDVARRAGVSISTVSRVLGGSAPVSAELRARVMQAVEELGYRPNAHARGLRLGRTGIIGLLVPDVSNPFFGELARVIEVSASRAGYNVLLCNSQNEAARERQYLDLLQSQRVDGLLVVASSLQRSDLERFGRATGARVVAMDRKIEGFEGPWVGSDPLPGCREAVEHLVALGHRRIGIVRGPVGVLASEERYQAMVRALEERGLSPSRAWTWAGEYTFETGARAGARLARCRPGERPTAVICGSELAAFGLIQAVEEAGLRVPDDLSVVGYDNTPFSAVCRPPLTVIAQPIERIGQVATRTLLRLLQAPLRRQPEPLMRMPGMGEAPRPAPGERRARSVALPTRLVVRQSTTAVPSPDAPTRGRRGGSDGVGHA